MDARYRRMLLDLVESGPIGTVLTKDFFDILCCICLYPTIILGNAARIYIDRTLNRTLLLVNTMALLICSVSNNSGRAVLTHPGP